MCVCVYVCVCVCVCVTTCSVIFIAVFILLVCSNAIITITYYSWHSQVYFQRAELVSQPEEILNLYQQSTSMHAFYIVVTCFLQNHY